jgi:arylsulfatase A-like enzyme
MRNFVLIGLFLAISCSPARVRDEVKLPNFIIVLVDDLGYGDLGCYGNPVNKTPNIDRLAAEGILFTDFYSAAPLCTPARAALLTGSYPIRVGMARTYKGECTCFPIDETGLHPDEITIAEVLKEKDYVTALIGKWHLGDQAEFHPNRQGFDYYYGILYSNDTGRGRFKWRGSTQLYEQPEIPLMRNEKVIEAPVRQETLTSRYTEEALEFIRDNADRPFFLYLAHTMPHYPISAGERFTGTSANGIYGDVVTELDWSVGEIMNTLEDIGIRENTMIFFTSDNGAPYSKEYNATNAPLSGYKGSAMEGGNRVPMIASWKGNLPEGKSSTALSSVMDFLPTIAELSGIVLPSDRVIDGKSLCGVLMDPGNNGSPHAWYAYYVTDQLKAIRTEKWKLYLPLEKNIGMWGEDYGPCEAKLYHLASDMCEKQDVSAEYPDKVAELMTLAGMARKWIGDMDKPTPNTRPAGFVEKPIPRTLKKNE